MWPLGGVRGRNENLGGFVLVNVDQPGHAQFVTNFFHLWGLHEHTYYCVGSFCTNWHLSVCVYPALPYALRLLFQCAAPFTGVVQVEGQQEVQEDVRQLLGGIGGQAVLHHAQEELHKLCIQVF